LRHGHDSPYIAEYFQQEIVFLGIKDAASYVHEPHGNGMAKRILRIIKDNTLLTCSISITKEPRLTLIIFNNPTTSDK
jgi:hypothetical protein